MSESKPNPRKRKAGSANVVAPSAAGQISMARASLLTAINNLMQDMIEATLIASTNKCNCEVCKIIREDAPLIREILKQSRKLVRSRR